MPTEWQILCIQMPYFNLLCYTVLCREPGRQKARGEQYGSMAARGKTCNAATSLKPLSHLTSIMQSD